MAGPRPDRAEVFGPLDPCRQVCQRPRGRALGSQRRVRYPPTARPRLTLALRQHRGRSRPSASRLCGADGTTGPWQAGSAPSPSILDDLVDAVDDARDVAAKLEEERPQYLQAWTIL